jgi:hypothetical protein
MTDYKKRNEEDDEEFLTEEDIDPDVNTPEPTPLRVTAPEAQLPTRESLLQMKQDDYNKTLLAQKSAKEALDNYNPEMDSKKSIGAAIATILPIIAGSVIAGKRGGLIGASAGFTGGKVISDNVKADQNTQRKQLETAYSLLNKEALGKEKIIASALENKFDEDWSREKVGIQEAGKNARNQERNAVDENFLSQLDNAKNGNPIDWRSLTSPEQINAVDKVIKRTQGDVVVYEGEEVGQTGTSTLIAGRTLSRKNLDDLSARFATVKEEAELIGELRAVVNDTSLLGSVVGDQSAKIKSLQNRLKAASFAGAGKTLKLELETASEILDAMKLYSLSDRLVAKVPLTSTAEGFLRNTKNWAEGNKRKLMQEFGLKEVPKELTAIPKPQSMAQPEIKSSPDVRGRILELSAQGFSREEINAQLQKEFD